MSNNILNKRMDENNQIETITDILTPAQETFYPKSRREKKNVKKGKR